MANNKVELADGTVLMDLTGDTVTPESLAEGVTATNAAGEKIVGTMPTTTVLYTEQTLTDEQKGQARKNIGVDKAVKSMTYNSSTNKWTITHADGSTSTADGPAIPDVSVYMPKSGGTMTGPLKITGGDAATAGKIALDETNKGQITDSGTGTLFGFNNNTALTLGHSKYALQTRGSAARPTYNGANMALQSDVPSAYTHPDTHPASMITGLSTVATSGSYNDLTNRPTIPSAYTHPSSHAASMISAGTFAGQVVANSSAQTPGTYLLRNIKLSTSAETPSNNGEICFKLK